jgi:predicted amidohydrolase
MSGTGTVRVAAVQIVGKVGDLAANVAHAETLATEALERGAQVVALPEFFTTPCFVHPRVRNAIVAADNPAREMLSRLARRYRAYVGGSMLTRRNGEVYNTYCLAGPGGEIQTHDKDLPTMWENAYYVGGHDDGVVETDFGVAGLAVCWELIRWRTVKRFAGRVRYAITGNQWWGIADNWVGARSVFGALGQFNRYLSENAPVELARILRVPVIHASHSGRFEGRFLLVPGSNAAVRYASEFVGRTQIVDAGGHVVAARDSHEGAGVVVGDILVGDVARAGPPLQRFWIPRLPLVHRLSWHQQNVCGRSYYRRSRR